MKKIAAGSVWSLKSPVVGDGANWKHWHYVLGAPSPRPVVVLRAPEEWDSYGSVTVCQGSSVRKGDPQMKFILDNEYGIAGEEFTFFPSQIYTVPVERLAKQHGQLTITEHKKLLSAVHWIIDPFMQAETQAPIKVFGANFDPSIIEERKSYFKGKAVLNAHDQIVATNNDHVKVEAPVGMSKPKAPDTIEKEELPLIEKIEPIEPKEHKIPTKVEEPKEEEKINYSSHMNTYDSVFSGELLERILADRRVMNPTYKITQSDIDKAYRIKVRPAVTPRNGSSSAEYNQWICDPANKRYVDPAIDIYSKSSPVDIHLLFDFKKGLQNNPIFTTIGCRSKVASALQRYCCWINSLSNDEYNKLLDADIKEEKDRASNKKNEALSKGFPHLYELMKRYPSNLKAVDGKIHITVEGLSKSEADEFFEVLDNAANADNADIDITGAYKGNEYIAVDDIIDYVSNIPSATPEVNRTVNYDAINLEPTVYSQGELVHVKNVLQKYLTFANIDRIDNYDLMYAFISCDKTFINNAYHGKKFNKAYTKAVEKYTKLLKREIVAGTWKPDRSAIFAQN